jgi:Helix-turn-helix domain
MSWQATAWAIKQRTGNARRKALLLALANYADAKGVCWPSQERLAEDTEQSIDSVQRHSTSLEENKLLRRELLPKRRGQYAGYRYYLSMESPSHSLRPDRAANDSQATPQSLRSKPSIEPSYKHSYQRGFEAADARLAAFQGKHEPLEVVQNRIARRIGDDGWLVLGDMNDNQRARLSTLERQGKLDEETLYAAVLQARSANRKA